MRRPLSLVVGLLSLSVTAQAHAQALPPGAADCFLGLISFKAQAVTGKEMLVPIEMYPSWRYYFANTYTTLPDPYSAANACWELDNISAKWPRMSLVERETWQNMWETSLLQEINFIGHVFPDAAADLRYALARHIADRLRETPQNAAPSATQDDAQTAAIIELERRRQFGNALLGWWQRY
jgi:hypothetical protein